MCVHLDCRQGYLYCNCAFYIKFVGTLNCSNGSQSHDVQTVIDVYVHTHVQRIYMHIYTPTSVHTMYIVCACVYVYMYVIIMYTLRVF